MIECKTSHADFRADAKKARTINPEAGMGCERWYLTPKRLLTPDQVPASWGLLEASKGRVYRTVQAPRRKTYDQMSEQQVLASELQAWQEATNHNPTLRVKTWQEKHRALADAAIVAKHGSQCPRCKLGLWEWDTIANGWRKKHKEVRGENSIDRLDPGDGDDGVPCPGR